MTSMNQTNLLTRGFQPLEERCMPSTLPPATIHSVVINEGAVQRSNVTVIHVQFDQKVSLPDDPALAFSLMRTSDSRTVDLQATFNPIDEKTLVELRFSGEVTEYGSLADGRYQLTAFAKEINGGHFDGNRDGIGGDDYVMDDKPENGLFRLFGDVSGDGRVDASDFMVMRQHFGGANSALDADGDGIVSAMDFVNFRRRFGHSL